MNKNDNIVMISKDIRVNEKLVRERLQDCGDIQIRRMRLGEERKVDCLMVYIEVATSNMMLEDSALGKMIGHFWEISPAQNCRCEKADGYGAGVHRGTFWRCCVLYGWL